MGSASLNDDTATVFVLKAPRIARSRYSRMSFSTAKSVAPARVATPILS
jgi:hypothetical protein